MDNLKKALEKNIEWIAIGIAGLWVVLLAWMFALQTPVVVELRGQPYSPSTADPVVADQARKLADMANSSSVPTLPVPSIQDDLVARLGGPTPPAIGELVLHSPPPRAIELTPGLAMPGSLADKIDTLPEIPAPRITAIQSDRDHLVKPKVEKVAMDNAATAAATPRPAIIPQYNPRITAGGSLPYNRMNMMRTQRPIMTPRPAAPGSHVILNNDVPPVDQYFVIVFAKFSEAALDAAFQKAKIPPFLVTQREFIEVQLLRQELLPDGTWGNEKLVPPLEMNAPPVDKDKQPDTFLAWALAPENQLLIVQPPFYTTPKWFNGPPVELPPDQLAEADFDPFAIAEQIRQLTTAEQTRYYNELGLTTEQKGKVYRALQELKEREAAEKRRERATENRTTNPREDRTTPRLPITPRGGRDAQDPGILREMLAQAAPPRDPRNPYLNNPNLRTTGRPNYGRTVPGAMPPGYMRPPVPMPNANPAIPADLQPTVVQPSNKAAGDPPVEFDLWAHDDTVEPGKTYRYKMRLMIKNPLYGTNMAKDPALAKPLALPIDKNASWSDWTKPVEVEPRVQMFLAGGAAGNNSQVRLDLYLWKDGKLNKPAQAVAVTPGDMIGGPDAKSGMDYSTGWTVADIRTVNNDTRVVLIDDNGAQKVRSLRADTSDARRKKLDQDYARQQQAEAAAAGQGIDPTMPGRGPTPGRGPMQGPNPAPTGPFMPLR